MTIFDRFVIGTFSAFCALLTGLIVSLVPFFVRHGHGTLDFTGPLFKASIVIAIALFILGFFGKIDLVVKVLTVPWKFLEALLKS